MWSVNGNERVAGLECGREYTRKDASRHRKHCDALKRSNCNFYTNSSEELTNLIKKKHCQHNVKLCAQHSPKTLRDKVKLIYFLLKIQEKTLRKIIFTESQSLYTKFEKILGKNLQFFHHYSCSVRFKSFD